MKEYTCGDYWDGWEGIRVIPPKKYMLSYTTINSDLIDAKVEFPEIPN